MRCPSCGTENAPDSRFCGGCGARLTPTGVAPTHKISDDARYPPQAPQAPQAPQPASAPVHVPMQMPAPRVSNGGPATSVPSSLARAATDPSEPAVRIELKRAATPVPLLQASSVALPRQGRRWGLVIAILVIDLGLATTGAVLLMQGLRLQDPAAPRAAPAPVVKTSAAEPVVTPIPAKPVMVVSKAVVKARPSPVVAAPAKVAAKPPAKKAKPTPVDPYAGSDSLGKIAGATSPAPSQDDEDHSAAISDAIDTKSTHAEAVFSRCYTQATKPMPSDRPLRGRIQIAFTVMRDGRVDHVSTAENQTGSDQLANCLASEIGGWTFAEHPQDPIDITKIFAFGPSSS